MATTATQDPNGRLSPGALLFMALLGLGVVFSTGHVQSQVLHDAAHDMRHAFGFPCH